MELLLHLRVTILRFLFSYNERNERRQELKAPEPTFIETIPSSSPRGSVSLHFYTLPGFQNGQKHDQSVRTKHPLVLVFHGGGFTAGAPGMDARWIASLLASETRPVVVSVDYGLAPENPFPGAIQDAVAAILWLANKGAEKHGLDPARTVLAGFSAGGTLAFVAPMWLHSNKVALPFPLRGVISMYPGMDFRVPRTPASSMLGRFLSGSWNQAFYDRSPIDSPFVSPAAAKDDLLRDGLPQRIGLYPVAGDDLLQPCEDFRHRLKALGKQVTGDVEPDAVHAWDKYPIKKGDVSRWEKRQTWFLRMTSDVEDMLQVI